MDRRSKIVAFLGINLVITVIATTALLLVFTNSSQNSNQTINSEANNNDSEVKPTEDGKSDDVKTTPEPSVVSPTDVVKPTKEPVINTSETFVSPVLNCTDYTFLRGMNPAHNGVDIGKKGGCWINSIGDGEVASAGWSNTGNGFNVVIDHKNGYVSSYSHGNGDFKVKNFDTVKKGDPIMYMGCTGSCTEEHLHIEIYKDGVLIDPLTLFSL